MAEEMVLRIVLEGVDNASDDFQKTGDAADDMGDAFTNAEKRGAALVVSVNALASGLNQMSGGIRKSADSMERLGWINEDTAESMRETSDVMEAFAGPMELISGIVTTAAAVLYMLSASGITVSGTMAFLGKAAVAVAGAVSATVLAVIALIGIIALATYRVYEYTEGFKEWDRVMDNIQWKIDAVKDGIQSITDAADDFSDAVKKITLGGIREKISDEIAGMGGSVL